MKGYSNPGRFKIWIKVKMETILLKSILNKLTWNSLVPVNRRKHLETCWALWHCIPRTREAEVHGSWVGCQPELRSKPLSLRKKSWKKKDGHINLDLWEKWVLVFLLIQRSNMKIFLTWFLHCSKASPLKRWMGFLKPWAAIVLIPRLLAWWP